MVIKNTKTDKLNEKKDFAKRDTSYSSFWLYNKEADMNSEHFKDSFVNFYDDKELLSEFNPTVAKNIISFWSEKGDIILDPFSGRTRALVSYAMDREYIGFEVSKDVTNYMEKRFEELNLTNKEDFKVQIINDDCINVNNYIEQEVDLIFSCPPYWDLERYESCQGQLSDIKNLKEFMTELGTRLNESIKYLKKGKYIAMVIGDFRKKGQYITLQKELLNEMQKNEDIKLHDIIIIQNIPFATSAFYFGGSKHKKQTAKSHEYLLIWQKKGGEKPKKKIITIKDMQEYAQTREGECLSEKYINMTTPLQWRCKEGHTWKSMPTSTVTRKQWCPICMKKNSGLEKLTIQEMRELAKEKGGECLSKEYINTDTKLEFKCAEGHTWKATGGSLKYGNKWCPKCRISYGENTTRQILEQLLQKKFPTIKPEWLINPTTQKKLELDGYNEELKLAFEYNGIQHINKNNAYHKTEECLQKQKTRDLIKKDACKQKGITLLQIPHTIHIEKLEEYIKEQLKKHNIKIINEKIKINQKEIHQPKKHKEYQEKVKQAGYELLTPYKGIKSIVTIRCQKGHEFEIEARSVFRNKGCPVCNGYRKKTIQEIKEKANELGYNTIDQDYIPGQRIKLECKKCTKQIKLRISDIFNKEEKCNKCEKQNGNI